MGKKRPVWLRHMSALFICYSPKPRCRGSAAKTWRSGYHDDEDPVANGNPRRVGPQSLWDAQLGYAASRDVDIAVGVKNLLDRDPPFAAIGGRFQQGYDPAVGDPRGRTWYARARLRWR